MKSKLKSIINELKNLQELTMQCMKCGICQSVCPLYEKDGLEPSVARGKISMIEAIFEGRIEDTPGTLKYLDYCILCGRCERFCPSGVKTTEIFIKAKEILRKIEKLPLHQKLLLKASIEDSRIMNNIEPFIASALKMVSSKAKESIRTINFPIKKNIESIKPKSFIARYGGLNRAEKEKMKVIFYPGCAINYMYTHWGEKIVKTLNFFGVSVYVPEQNICCGVPAVTMGELELYRKLALKNKKWFDSIKDASYIITACPTCQWGIGELSLQITGENSKIPILDILIFLKEILHIKVKADNSKKTTLHIPCHYDHSKDNEMMEFIKNNISTTMEPLNNQNCCGFGGTFNLKHHKDSEEVGGKKIKEVKDKKYSVIYTPCPGCVMQLTDVAIKNDCNVDVKHPVEGLYENIKIGSKDVR